MITALSHVKPQVSQVTSKNELTIQQYDLFLSDMKNIEVTKLQILALNLNNYSELE